MTLPRRRCLFLAGCLLLGVLASGCGGSAKTFKVKGQVTNAGNPIPVQTQGAAEHVLIRFEPIAEGSESSKKPAGNPPQAVVDPSTGRFAIDVPPGKYRICVIHFAGVNIDKLDGKFGKDKSPILRTITGNEEINIDVSRPNG